MVKKDHSSNAISDLFAIPNGNEAAKTPPAKARALPLERKTKRKFEKRTRSKLLNKKPDPNTTEQYFTDFELAARFKVARQTIWRWVRSGSFPQPVKLASNTSRWRECDIRAFESNLKIPVPKNMEAEQ